MHESAQILLELLQEPQRKMISRMRESMREACYILRSSVSPQKYSDSCIVYSAPIAHPAQNMSRSNRPIILSDEPLTSRRVAATIEIEFRSEFYDCVNEVLVIERALIFRYCYNPRDDIEVILDESKHDRENLADLSC